MDGFEKLLMNQSYRQQRESRNEPRMTETNNTFSSFDQGGGGWGKLVKQSELKVKEEEDEKMRKASEEVEEE